MRYVSVLIRHNFNSSTFSAFQ